MRKRILAMILAALMLGTSAPVSVMAASDDDYTDEVEVVGESAEIKWEYYVLDDETLEILGYTYDEGEPSSITIPESIDGKAVTRIGDYVFSDCGSRSITIPEGVTSIGIQAFFGCENLSSITIPGSVKNIGRWAFSNSGLTSVILQEGVTGIGQGVFASCTRLSSVTIPGSAKSTGEDTFSGCRSLSSVTLSEGITSIGDGSFEECSSLSSITIPKSVTSIENKAFEYCTSLSSITIPEGVTSIGSSAFSYCSSLSSATIPGSAKSTGEDTFENCTSLSSVTLSEGITNIGDGAFSYCRSLSSITIPKSVTSIGTSAFFDCEKLSSITIPESVTEIGYGAFAECGSLSSITIPESVTSIDDQVFDNCLALTMYCVQDSAAHRYAVEWEIPYSFIKSNHPTKVTSITLNKKTATLKKGGTLSLTASASPASASNKSVTWTSSNEKVATVDKNGKVTAKGNGTATITATAADGSGKKDSCTVQVPYTITYKLNGGKKASNPATYLNEAVTLKNPTRANYVFKGWYTDSKFKHKITQIKKGTKQNYTLYAKWEKVTVKATSVTSAKNNKSKQIQVAYKKVSGVKGYEISYSTDKKFKKSVKKTLTSKTTGTIKKLKKGKTYYVRVRAYKTDSTGKKVYSKPSNVKKVTITK